MERREFMGAMAALFGAVVLPEPIREALIITPAEALWSPDVIAGTGVIDSAKIDAMLKEIYMQPILDNTFNEIQLYMNTVFGTAMDGVQCFGKTHYFDIQRS